jgi:hypothetical protein
MRCVALTTSFSEEAFRAAATAPHAFVRDFEHFLGSLASEAFA